MGRFHRHAQTLGPGRHFRAVRGQRVVVERWGHMRSLHGRAYDPALFPAGVKIDEIS